MSPTTRGPAAPRARLLTVLAILAAALTTGGCAAPDRPATMTIRNDALQPVDVHYAVLAPDGNPATPGETGVQHLTVEAGGAIVHEIVDPTAALAAAERGSVIMRALVTPAGQGPDAGQWVDLKSPGPFVLRASPMGAGIRVERVEDQPIDDRQMRDLTRNEPPRPGRASTP